jgi:hypothetical protein
MGSIPNQRVTAAPRYFAVVPPRSFIAEIIDI